MESGTWNPGSSESSTPAATACLALYWPHPPKAPNARISLAYIEQSRVCMTPTWSTNAGKKLCLSPPYHSLKHDNATEV